MIMKKILALIVLALVVFAVLGFMFDWGSDHSMVPQSSDDATTTSDMPTVFSPADGQTVASPIHVNGKVSGNWFFEGSFPVELIDANGDVIATSTAQTSGDWATTSVIDFSATLYYAKATTTERALIMLKNDDPSGDPARDRESFIQVILK